MIAALIGSRWVLYAAMLFAGTAAYEGWKYHQQHVGASKLEVKIEQKADADAQKAEIVREAVAAAMRQPAPPAKPNRVCEPFERCAGH